jgi:dihydroneopterin aldolase
VVRADVEHQTKLPIDIVEALDQSIGDLAMQELDAAVACRTVAVPPPGAPIEQHQWEVVGSGHRGETCGSGLTKVPAT